MLATVQDIVEFYHQYPEELGQLMVDTRFGFKSIQYADVSAYDSAVIEVCLLDGATIYTSPEHRLLCDDTWTHVNQLGIGSLVHTRTGVSPVSSIKLMPCKEDLYDLQVADVHEFYANDVVSHNSTLFNALSYSLYGQALTNIRKDNLINTINKKNMMVIMEFEKNGISYKIERGRKPNFFRYYVNNTQQSQDSQDEAQGENRETQKSIDQVLGVSYQMFRHIICLNTYTEPFLSMSASKQREVIEELLGITQLSMKAENLKELIKATKLEIDQEQFRISTVQNSNQRIQQAIVHINNQITQWTVHQQENMDKIQLALDQMNHVNSEQEIQNHNNNQQHKELVNKLSSLQTLIAHQNQSVDQLYQEQRHLLEQYANAENHSCPMCGQQMHQDQHKQLVKHLEKAVHTLDQKITLQTAKSQELVQERSQLELLLHQTPHRPTFYKQITQAYDHKNSVQQMQAELLRLQNETNPHVNQMNTLHDTLQEVNYDHLNELNVLKEHQEFLLRLLVNKDSFIRKRIIDQNLAYVNHRLHEYLTVLGINHQVKFQNDLNVEINYMAQDMDFAQLSRGESTRVILALSWAFRDIFENTNTSINFIGVDELIDVGIDSAGVEKAMEILKNMARDRNKNIFLISHKEELIPRVANILTVVKENGFTRFVSDYDIL